VLLVLGKWFSSGSVSFSSYSSVGVVLIDSWLRPPSAGAPLGVADVSISSRQCITGERIGVGVAAVQPAVVRWPRSLSVGMNERHASIEPLQQRQRPPSSVNSTGVMTDEWQTVETTWRWHRRGRGGTKGSFRGLYHDGHSNEDVKN